MNRIKSVGVSGTVAAVAIVAMLGGCSSWQTADKTQGAMAGAAGGAVAGALVGGPIGAVIGGVGGAFVGHETTGYESKATTTPAPTATATPTPTSSAYDASTIRAVQQALNSRGYNAGAIDGQWSASTQDAVRRFQQASGLPVTGDLNPTTLSALGLT